MKDIYKTTESYKANNVESLATLALYKVTENIDYKLVKKSDDTSSESDGNSLVLLFNLMNSEKDITVNNFLDMCELIAASPTTDF